MKDLKIILRIHLDEEWNAAGKIAKKLGDLKLARRYYGKAKSYCAVRKIDRQLKKQNRRTLDSKAKDDNGKMNDGCRLSNWRYCLFTCLTG